MLHPFSAGWSAPGGVPVGVDSVVCRARYGLAELFGAVETGQGFPPLAPPTKVCAFDAVVVHNQRLRAGEAGDRDPVRPRVMGNYACARERPQS